MANEHDPLDIALLNQADLEQREADLMEYVENLSSIHELNDLDDSDSFFSSSSASAAEPNKQSQVNSINETKVNHEFSQPLQSSRQMENHPLEDDLLPQDETEEYELVTRLTSQLHEKAAEGRSCLLKANHLQLKVEALQSDREELVIEKDQLSLELLQMKENYKLLEARLKEVAHHEHLPIKTSVESLRGKLLEEANQRYTELLDEYHSLKRQSTRRAEEDSETILQYQSIVEATKKELENVCYQMATQSILYKQLQRNHQHLQSTHSNRLSANEKEYYLLQGELTAMTHNFQQTSQELQEMNYKFKSLEKEYQTLQVSHEQLQETFQELEGELMEARNVHLADQSMIHNLRHGNGDYDQLELDHQQQMIEMRREVQQKERQYQEQISQLSLALQKNNEEKEELHAIVLRLQQEERQMSQLLYQIQEQGLPSFLNGKDDRKADPDPPTETISHVIETSSHPTKPLRPNQVPDENGTEDTNSEDGDDRSVSWLFTPTPSEIPDPHSPSHAKRREEASFVIESWWLKIFPKTLRLAIQWTDLWPFHRRDDVPALGERGQRLCEKLLEKEDLDNAVKAEILDSFSSLIAPIWEEIGNLLLQNQEVAEKVFSDKYHSDVRKLKEKVTHMKQKCQDWKEFARKILEKASDKKMIQLSEIPQELSLSLSPNSSYSFQAHSLIASPSIAADRAAKSDSTDLVSKLEESLSVRQQEIERLESQIGFYQEENEALHQQIREENQRQERIEQLEHRLAETEESLRSQREQHNKLMEQSELQAKEKERVLILQIERKQEEEIQQITEEKNEECHRRLLQLRGDYSIFIRNLVDSVRQFQHLRDAALLTISEQEEIKSRALRELEVLRKEVQGFRSLQQDLQAQIDGWEAVCQRSVDEAVLAEAQRHEGNLRALKQEKEELQRVCEELRSRYEISASHSVSVEQRLSELELEHQSALLQLSTISETSRLRDISEDSLMVSETLVEDSLHQSHRSPIYSRYLEQLHATISSCQHSKLVAIEKLRTLTRNFTNLQAEYLSQQQLFSQLSEDKLIVYRKVQSLSALIEQQERQIQLQRDQYQAEHRELSLQYEESRQHLLESHQKELARWQKHFKKEYTLQRKEFERQLDDLCKSFDDDRQSFLSYRERSETELEQYREREAKLKTDHEMLKKELANVGSATETTDREANTELSVINEADEASWFLSPEKPGSVAVDKESSFFDDERKEVSHVSEIGASPSNCSREIQTDPILLDHLISALPVVAADSRRKDAEDVSLRELTSPTVARRSLTPSSFLSPPTQSIHNSSEFEKLLSSIQEEESNLQSVKLELKELVSENMALQQQKHLLEEDNALLSTQLLKCNDQILYMQQEYARLKEHYSQLLAKDEVLVSQLAEAEKLLSALRLDQMQCVAEKEELSRQLQEATNPPDLPLPTRSSSPPKPALSSDRSTSQHAVPRSSLERSHLEVPHVSIPSPASIIPPANNAAIPAPSSSEPQNITVDYLKQQLEKQKAKLLHKFQKKYDRQQQFFETEKEMILHMLKNECREIISETNRLLLAKRDLALQQSQVNEIIHELSQRAIFASPSQPPDISSESLKSQQKKATHPVMISPISALSNPSHHIIEVKTSGHHSHNSQSRPSPFPLRQETSRDEKGNHHSSHRSPPTAHQRNPTHRSGDVPSEEKRKFMSSSLLVRESINSLLSSSSSLPASITSSLNLNQPHDSSYQQIHSNPQEHLFRLYPEMIPPKVTKKLIHKILQHQSQNTSQSTD